MTNQTYHIFKLHRKSSLSSTFSRQYIPTICYPRAMLAKSFAPCWFAFVLMSVLGSLCPVSKHYDDKQHFHRYPHQFYYPVIDRLALNQYSCNSQILNEPPSATFSLCDRNVSLCPVREENIQSALGVATWPQYADVFAKMKNLDSINVFYLGGSMTNGAETLCRCRCSNIEDSRCPPFPAGIGPDVESTYCSWTNHLTRWFHRVYPTTKFHIHDYSMTGRDSRSSAYLIHMLKTSEANLSKPALFFLDYSVNDVIQNSSVALETLVHTIHDNFGRHYNVRPTIVVLEQYSHRNVFGPNFPDRDYVSNYRLLAQRYKLILISLREVYWTYFGPPQSRNVTHPDLSKRLYSISPFEANVHQNLHAPWYIHLFIADVVAECIKRISVHFTAFGKASPNTIHNLHDRTIIPTVSYTPPGPLPSMLYNGRSELQQVCNIAVPFAVSAIARPINTPEEQLNWKIGWIEHVSHRTANWEINSHSNHTHRALSFPLAGDTTVLQGNIVMISYLKSYEGMGTASVQLCGGVLANSTVIEGLWDYQISMPWPVTFVLQAEDLARCALLPPQHRFLSVVYTPGKDRKELRAVHHQEFKVFYVEVCAPVVPAGQLYCLESCF